MKTLTLYTRLGCHLCEEAEATISAVGRGRKFRLIRRDICEDAADYERYKHDVPVVMVDGVEVARHRMSAAQLIAALSGEPPRVQ